MNLKNYVMKQKAIGIKIILDGVLSYTGSDSKYFNKLGNYNEVRSISISAISNIIDWYKFTNYP